jgi:hypothetical protein
MESTSWGGPETMPMEMPFTGINRLLRELDAAAIDEDEHAPHVVVVVDRDLGPGPAAGPFAGALPALVAAEQLEAALNEQSGNPPVRTQVIRLFTPERR